VIDKEPSSDLGAGMDLDARGAPGDVRQQAGQQSQAMAPQKVGHAVRPDGP